MASNLLSLPSQYLPLLRPIPTLEILIFYTLQLQTIVNPSNIIINLVELDLEEDEVVEEETDGLDEFELNFIQNWCMRCMNLVITRLGNGFDDTEEEEEDEGNEEIEWSELLKGLTDILSNLSGHGAAGPSTKTYILPTSLPIPNSTLSIQIRETTLLSDSTGFRTWGSASLFSKLITLNPFDFFGTTPPSPSPTGAGSRSKEGKMRILELGSGTGLVGITIIKLLELLELESEVILTDYEPTILSNLSHNLLLNNLSTSTSTSTTTSTSKVEIKIKHLDWQIYSLPSPSPSLVLKEERFNLIFASDVIFESTHPQLIHSVLSHLLSFPSPSPEERSIKPTCHLSLPIRSTHTKEINLFLHLFNPSSSSSNSEEEDNTTIDSNGLKWKLIWDRKEIIWGYDGFGTKSASRKGRGRGGGGEKREYWIFRICWSRVWT